MLGNQNKQNAENSFVWYDGIVETIVTLVITSVISNTPTVSSIPLQ